MRNLKKLLALVLALVMTMSLMVTANAANTEYSDKDSISADFATAVQVLSDMGIFKGTTGGETQTFNPKGEITRAEVSALVYRMISTDVPDKQIDLYNFASFDDVPADKWFTSYVTFAANGEYVVGDGQGKFYPDMKVTGVQVLAIMLRALGYGKMNEYQGSGWEIRVMTDAKKLGLTNGVNEGALNRPAPREVVAQLLWNTMRSDYVDYTALLGYSNKNGANPLMMAPTLDSLTDAKFGVKQFNLRKTPGKTDWYDPTYKYEFTTGKKESIIASEPEYKTYERVDECDVVKAIAPDMTSGGLAIESCYIDGKKVSINSSKVTTDGSEKLDALKETSYLGAQGRETKIYDMSKFGGEGYRIVEKNTYLAQVTKYNKSTTDKNGHVKDPSIDMNIIYAASDADTYSERVRANCTVGKDDVYTAGEYILVNARFDFRGTHSDMENLDTTGWNKVTDQAVVKSGSVEIIDKAEMVSAGKVSAHKRGYHEISYATKTPGEITAGGKQLICADKFFLNHLDTQTKIWSNKDTAWTAIMDGHGNVIGLTTTSSSVMLIEGIRWIGDGSTVFGGKAQAQILKADGTRETVTVSKINDKTATHTGRTPSDPDNGTVDTSWADNADYYRHLYAYTVNEDGSYSIFGHKDGAFSSNSNMGHTVCGQTEKAGVNVTVKNGAINKGFSYVLLDGTTGARLPVDNSTVFMVANEVYPSNHDDANRALPGTQYTVYTGKDAVPTLKNTEVCYAIGADGFADVVVVSAWRNTSNIFGAYVPYQVYDTPNATYRINYGWAYEVYKIGETTPTTVWFNEPEIGIPAITSEADVKDPVYGMYRDAIYVLEIDSLGRVVNPNGVTLGDGEKNGNALGDALVYGMVTDADYAQKATGTDDAYIGAGDDAFDYGVVTGRTERYANNAIGVYGEDDDTLDRYKFTYTMSVDSSTKYLMIARDSTNGVDVVNSAVQYIAEIAYEDLEPGDRVTVLYDLAKSGSYEDMVAKYVYVLRDLKSWKPNTTDAPDNSYKFSAADFGVYAANADDVGTVVYAVAREDAVKAMIKAGGWTYSMYADTTKVNPTNGTVTTQGEKLTDDQALASGLDTSEDWYVVGWFNKTTIKQNWSDGERLNVSMVFSNGTATERTATNVVNWMKK